MLYDRPDGGCVRRPIGCNPVSDISEVGKVEIHSTCDPLDERQVGHCRVQSWAVAVVAERFYVESEIVGLPRQSTMTEKCIQHLADSPAP